jgi:hypothetical protein
MICDVRSFCGEAHDIAPEILVARLEIARLGRFNNAGGEEEKTSCDPSMDVSSCGYLPDLRCETSLVCFCRIVNLLEGCHSPT